MKKITQVLDGIPQQFQSRTLTTRRVDRVNRTVELSFSSEEPYERAFGVEILDHSPGAIVDERFRRGAVPFLLNHDWNRQIGTVLGYNLSGSKAYAKVQLSRSSEGQDILTDIEDGIRSNISVGYVVHSMEEIGQEKGKSIFKVTRWEPLEISLVSVPADSTVGIGREAESERAWSNAMEQHEWDKYATPELFAYLDQHGGLERMFAAYQKAGGKRYTEFLDMVSARAKHLAEIFQGWPIR
jgi:HK97 family phage prohead protease